MFSSRKTAAPSTGYNLTKSLRFRSSASAYLNRTLTTPTNNKIFTWSGWIKLGTAPTAYPKLFAAASSRTTNSYDNIGFDTNNITIEWNGASSGYLVTSQVFRDPSAWYHVVVAVDTTQATASNRCKVYVNGTQVTSFSTATYPAQNYTQFFNSAIEHRYGAGQATSGLLYFYDGEQTETYFIDGQALTPSSFGSTNSLTGVWQPAKYTGTYGTNGFYLKFTDTTSTATLGTDYSGNSNTWTVNNISLTTGSTYDSMNDVPTLTSATQANYCVLNPLSALNSSTTADGNLKGTLSAASVTTDIYGTVATNSGKVYWETTYVSRSGNSAFGIGLVKVLSSGYPDTTSTGGIGYYSVNGVVYIDGSSAATYATFTTNDVIGIALDITNSQVTFYKNNTSQGTLSIASGNSWTPSWNNGTSSGNQVFTANFGQQGFTYTPPTGFVALNTYNLPTSTIVKGNTVMDATLYTGTLLSNAITNTAGFKPDLVWIKSRSAATDNKLTDSVRGTTKGLISNTTGAETTDTQGLTAFGTNGFTVGTNTDYNNLTATYVGWQWQAGQGSSSSNTSGSITSTVSVNASAGFSVVTWTDSASTYTVGHGLGVAPQFIILKDRSNAYNWDVGCNAIGWANRLKLNDTTATSAGYWNSTAPTSSVFTYIGNGTGNMVAYCWTPIAGFSSFGSYTGNGSADGPFVYTGFRPKFVMFKRAGAGDTTSWFMFDTSRAPYNLVLPELYANLSAAEGTDGKLDILSNGFKIRTTSSTANSSSIQYIYMAFAENPFKNALAR